LQCENAFQRGTVAEEKNGRKDEFRKQQQEKIRQTNARNKLQTQQFIFY
jgi:hypothetical protein